MAIIGQSQNSTLYQRVTTEDSKYRKNDYWDTVSNERPLIVKDIPDLDETKGGAGFIPDVIREAEVRIDDTERITKLLFTKYQGIKWQGHNAALTAIQNELDSKRGHYAGESNDLGTLLGTLVNVGRGALKALDLDAVALAQTAVAGTGEHFTAWQSRAYINDTNTFGGVIGNVLAQLGLGGSGDGSAAQAALSTGKVLVNPNSINGRQLPDSDNEAIREAQKPGEAGLKITSATGVPWKTINTYSSASSYESYTDPNNIINQINTGEQQLLNSLGLDNLTQIEEQRVGVSFLTDSRSLEKAQKPKRGKYYHSESGSLIENTERGDQGQVSWSLDNRSGSYLEQQGIQKHTKFTEPSASPYEAESKGPWAPAGIQSLISAKSSNVSSSASDGGNSNDTVTFRDRWTRGDASTRVDNGRIEMIPFYIRAICPGDSGQYGSGRAPSGENGYLFFEANLDSYSDNYDASWQSTEYIGRADKFWNYNGFDRQISFSFKMVAHSKSHLRPIYNRLNGLLSMTTPTYGTQADGGSFMRGTLAEITIGDLLSQQLGFIKSVGLKWETDYMWETDTGTIMVPHVLDVSVNFTPIHRFVPHTDLRYFQLVNSGSGDVDTFIVNHNVLYKH